MIWSNSPWANIVTFKADKTTGCVAPAGHAVAVAKPVCLQAVSEFK
ncbi:hypothetical protein [Pontibacter amylolyticus]|nr:hypothetical protein [Pontibacter amylolyticus]